MKTFLLVAPIYIQFKKSIGFTTEQVRKGLTRHLEKIIKNDGICLQCGEQCYRDEVDVMGPGYPKMTGPWCCPNCGWSEDERYDLSKVKR